jgi:FkbM family methyltransferase
MIFSKVHRAGPAALRRFSLSKFFNYIHPFSISNKTFKIPILGGLGEDLLKLTPDFKAELIRMFGNDLPNCFVDVGANIGQTIIECFSQKNWDSYYALEPNPLACSYLQNLVDVNRLPVTILPWAAGPNSLPKNFYATGPVDGAATMAPEGRPGIYTPHMRTSVASYPLDLLLDLDLARISAGVMIKIDVEGFEAEVLEGAHQILSEIRPILLCEVLRAYRECEITFTNQRMLKLEEILNRHRFRIFAIEMDGEISGQIQALKELPAFPRGLYRDNPSGMDYVFVPAEKPLPDGCFTECAK